VIVVVRTVAVAEAADPFAESLRVLVVVGVFVTVCRIGGGGGSGSGSRLHGGILRASNKYLGEEMLSGWEKSTLPKLRVGVDVQSHISALCSRVYPWRPGSPAVMNGTVVSRKRRPVEVIDLTGPEKSRKLVPGESASRNQSSFGILDLWVQVGGLKYLLFVDLNLLAGVSRGFRRVCGEAYNQRTVEWWETKAPKDTRDVSLRAVVEVWTGYTMEEGLSITHHFLSYIRPHGTPESRLMARWIANHVANKGLKYFFLAYAGVFPEGGMEQHDLFMGVAGAHCGGQAALIRDLELCVTNIGDGGVHVRSPWNFVLGLVCHSGSFDALKGLLAYGWGVWMWNLHWAVLHYDESSFHLLWQQFCNRSLPKMRNKSRAICAAQLCEAARHTLTRYENAMRYLHSRNECDCIFGISLLASGGGYCIGMNK
jgi:hypothetical protein